jgi:branched-chain amino acid transport system substrate-binding protein
MRITKPSRLAIPAILAAVALSAAACGGGDDDSSGSGSSSSAAASTTSSASALGTPNKATGSAVTIGMISDGKGQNVDQTAEIKGAQAAIDYANDYLGGLGGHPITLKVCETLGNPATATDCANQMVTAKVSGVIAGTLAEADQVISVLSPAGIPGYFSQAASAKGLTSAHVYSLTNALNYFTTPAAYGAGKGYKSANYVVIDVPGAAGPAKATGGDAFKNLGLAYSVTAIAPGTPDMTPQMTAADQKSPAMYAMLGDSTFCTSALKALKTIGTKADIVIAETCVSSAAAGSIPGGYAGVKVVSSQKRDPKDPDYAAYLAALDKYESGTSPTAGNSGIGYAVGLAVVRAANASKITDTSPTGLETAVKTAPALPYPLMGGATFQCNGTAISVSANICSASGLVATLDKDGNQSDYQVVDGAKAYPAS